MSTLGDYATKLLSNEQRLPISKRPKFARTFDRADYNIQVCAARRNFENKRVNLRSAGLVRDDHSHFGNDADDEWRCN